MSDQEKIKRINEYKLAFCNLEGLNAEDIHIIAIDQNINVILSYDQPMSSSLKGAIIRKLEFYLKEKADRQLCIYLQSKKDINPLRRHLVPKETQVKMEVS